MTQHPEPADIFSPDVLKELEVALKEVGNIEPWFDKEVDCWVFEHELYPESYGGESKEEVIQGYPLYLGQLIQHRMEGTLADSVEKRVKGHGGHRPGAGRPKGTIKEATLRISIPADVAQWLKADPSNIEKIRGLMDT